MFSKVDLDLSLCNVRYMFKVCPKIWTSMSEIVPPDIVNFINYNWDHTLYLAKKN